MKILTALLVLSQASRASAACVDWKAMGPFADIEAATVVFEGAVERIEMGDVATCAPDRVVFIPDRVWKGVPSRQYVLLQENRGRVNEILDGRKVNRGCPISAESAAFSTTGARYIVFASGRGDDLRAWGCGMSSTPTTQQRRRLDKWQATTASAKRK